jgi:hypothetical protein
MLRQRLRTRRPALALIGNVLVFVLACALVFYGVILALLAFKVSSSTLNDISAYQTAYDGLADLREGDLGDTLRIAAGLAGAVVFVLFGYLALKQLPRPYLARHELELKLADDPRGAVTVEPRAIERVVETAALQHPELTAASGRYGDDELAVGVTVRHAKDLSRTLEDVQASIVEALDQHGLPAVPIHLTLTGYERRTHRELD